MGTEADLMQALRNAHSAGDQDGARRLAGMIKRHDPSFTEEVAHFARGAIPWGDQLRGAIDATVMKATGNDYGKSWGELQDTYAGDQQLEEWEMKQWDPERARNISLAGTATGTLALAGGLPSAAKAISGGSKGLGAASKRAATTAGLVGGASLIHPLLGVGTFAARTQSGRKLMRKGVQKLLGTDAAKWTGRLSKLQKQYAKYLRELDEAPRS